MTSSQQRGLKTLTSWVSYVREKERLQLPSFSFTMSRVILVDARPLHPPPMSLLMEKLHSVIHQEVERFGSTTIVWMNGEVFNKSNCPCFIILSKDFIIKFAEIYTS